MRPRSFAPSRLGRGVGGKGEANSNPQSIFPSWPTRHYFFATRFKAVDDKE